MCWESNSRAIVMLTRCIEKGREKCDHYWPYDTLPVYYGDISVTILNDSHYPDWSVTEFMMCRVSSSALPYYSQLKIKLLVTVCGYTHLCNFFIQYTYSVKCLFFCVILSHVIFI